MRRRGDGERGREPQGHVLNSLTRCLSSLPALTYITTVQYICIVESSAYEMRGKLLPSIQVRRSDMYPASPATNAGELAFARVGGVGCWRFRSLALVYASISARRDQRQRPMCGAARLLPFSMILPPSSIIAIENGQLGAASSLASRADVHQARIRGSKI
jgi:hypothetical protein